MEQLIKDMKAQIEAICADIDKVENKAAQARVRKQLSSSRNSAKFIVKKLARSNYSPIGI